MTTKRSLNELAKRLGLQTSYEDVTGRRRTVSGEALLRGLQILGAPLERPEDAEQALAQLRQAELATLVPPVVVAWNGRLPKVPLGLVESESGSTVSARLELEDGQIREQTSSAADLAAVTKRGAEPESGYQQRALQLRGKLPLGYHRLHVTVGQRSGEALIIAAPKKLDSGMLTGKHREWGLFAPLYAVHGESGWGAGGIAEYDRFGRWVRERGGTLVAALPLLASFFENAWDFSPYSPASRLFWNELFVDVTRTPEFAQCEPARELFQSEGFQGALAEMRSSELVDYPRLMTLKRRVLQRLADSFFSRDSSQRERFEAFRRGSPDLDPYAWFRAACERHGRPWTQWPDSLQSIDCPPEAVDEAVRNYHLYAQWTAHEQLEALSEAAHEAGMTWYLDLPLGTHADGYDVWRYREVFAMGAAGGAPPDAFFTKGQNWGFPPLHPHRLREQRYAYLIRVLRHHLHQAHLLRIDHVMGLHRLYWVPDGLPASQGVYVKYPADELYAILLLEAHRENASIIGENLGTVPPYVNRDMRKHGFGRLFVLQYEISSPASEGRSPDPDEVASLNTHDMPTFATWWEGADVDDRLELGLLNESEAAAERENREGLRQTVLRMLRAEGVMFDGPPDAAGVLEGCLRWLASSSAPVLLINVEDLWLERQAQNTPGTVAERVNWRRKTRLTLDEMEQSPQLQRLLEIVQQARQGRPAADIPEETGDPSH